MAERHVIGSDLAPNKELNGSGSTAVAGWINSAAEKWALVSIGAVTPTVAEFTEWQGRRSLHLNIASASAGAVVGVSQIPEYSAATITSASLPYLIKMKPGHSYTVSCDVYVPTGAVNCNPSLLYRRYTNVLARTGSVAALTNSTRDSWVTLTTTFTALANETYYVFLIGLTQDSASTFSGEMYISNISMVDNTETARTTATSRTTATNRVAVRDMGTALSFDGVSNFVEIPAIASLSGGGTRTVASWIFYAGLINDNEGIFGMGANSNGNMFYLRTASANNRFQMTTFGTDAYSANGSLIKNKWNHVVGVISSTDIRLYVNGVLSGTPVTLNHTLNVTSSVARIGRRFNSTEYLKGKIDNTRVYNIALTATEVANMYFSNIVPINGLVAEYLFNETTGSTALDTSGNGNNGTITGATYTLDVPLKLRTEA